MNTPLNSWVALDQDEYEKRYAELTARYDKAKAGDDDIAGQIDRKNMLAVIPISIFMVCHFIYGMVNYII